MLLDHAERDRVLDLEPVTEVAEVLAAQQAPPRPCTGARRCVATWSRSSTPRAPIRAWTWAPRRAPA